MKSDRGWQLGEVGSSGLNGFKPMEDLAGKWDDKDRVMSEVLQRGHMLRWASERLQDDKEVVLAAVQSDTRVLEWASDRLRNDEDVVLAAVKSSVEKGESSIVNGVGKEILGNKLAMLRLVRLDWFVLSIMSEELRDDAEIVLAALETCKNTNPLGLYASNRLAILCNAKSGEGNHKSSKFVLDYKVALEKLREEVMVVAAKKIKPRIDDELNMVTVKVGSCKKI